MLENEWEADRQLTTAQVARAVRSQVSGISATKVELMGSGWDSDAYVVDEQWAFRFPRRREVAEGIGTAIKIAAVVAAALSDLGVAVPGPAMLGEPCRDFPYRFSGYRLLPGVAADQLPEDRLDVDGLTRSCGCDP